MYTIVALFGKSGAGKDIILLDTLALSDKREIKHVITSTTREPRDNEVNGLNYNFLSHEEFSEKLLNDEIIEASVFNHWIYGTDINELDENKINLGVFSINSIEILLERNDIKVVPIQIVAKDKLRLMRALEREENPNIKEILRRYEADEKDFKIIDFEYHTIENNDNSRAATLELLDIIKDLGRSE